MAITSKAQLVTAMKAQITGTDAMACKALMKVYAGQTASEQACGNTHLYNGVGFTGADGELLSSFARQYERKGSLSEKQMVILKKKIGKYARQLVENSLACGMIKKSPSGYQW